MSADEMAALFGIPFLCASAPDADGAWRGMSSSVGMHCAASSAPGLTLVRETPDVETSSDGYASRFRGAAGAYFLSVQQRGLEALLARDAPLRETTVLDVGGGHGQLAAPLAAHGCHVTVVGSTPECRVRIVGAGSGQRIQFVAGDLLDLPFSDRSFDIVVSVRLISHIKDWPRLVAEFCRVARRAVVIDYPSLASINVLSLLSFRVKLAIEKNTRHYRSFWPSELSREFRRHAFRPTASFRQFLFPMAAHRLSGGNVLRSLEEAGRRAKLTSIAGNPVLIRFDRSESAV
jgi:ubiquinone/menaquinone biosynthesis C-methylase UbiE